MGCCMSSTAKRHPPHPSPSRPPPQIQPYTSQHNLAVTKPPPPTLLEEETVKEVLSETPISKPPQNETNSTQIPSFQRHPKIQAPIFQEFNSQTQIFARNNKRKEDEERERTPEISQASEICSNADSYSIATTNTTTTATTTITEIREEHEVTSKKRLVNRSPSKLPRKRPYTADREKRLPKITPPNSRAITSASQRGNVGCSRVGRDLGERSGRRSRSPATRGTGGGVVKGRAGGSPAKVTGKAVGKAEEVGVGSGVKLAEKSENGSNVSMQEQGQESLDNPLVALECFIFL